MTRKHFQLVADILRAELDTTSPEFRRLREAFADQFALDNPRFNRERFYAACLQKSAPNS